MNTQNVFLMTNCISQSLKNPQIHIDVGWYGTFGQIREIKGKCDQIDGINIAE